MGVFPKMLFKAPSVAKWEQMFLQVDFVENRSANKPALYLSTELHQRSVRSKA